MARYFCFDSASFLATWGISQAPGTQTTVTSDSLPPCRTKQSFAPARSCSVTRVLNRDTTTAILRPWAVNLPSITAISPPVVRFLGGALHGILHGDHAGLGVLHGHNAGRGCFSARVRGLAPGRGGFPARTRGLAAPAHGFPPSPLGCGGRHARDPLQGGLSGNLESVTFQTLDGLGMVGQK